MKEESRNSSVIIGQEICDRLRNIYFPDKKYADIHKHLTRGLMILKNMAKIYYPEANDLEILNNIRKWTDNDIKEAIQSSKDRQGKAI